MLAIKFIFRVLSDASQSQFSVKSTQFLQRDKSVGDAESVSVHERRVQRLEQEKMQLEKKLAGIVCCHATSF